MQQKKNNNYLIKKRKILIKMKRKTHIITLLLFVFAIAMAIVSCNDKEGDSEDDFIPVLTNSIAQNYFKPKKANLFVWEGSTIIGDWYSNEKIRFSVEYSDIYNGYLDRSQTDDYAQEYAEHYFFLSDDNFKKYKEKSLKSNKKGVMVDDNDIASPYKDYASYYGDTAHLTIHDCYPFDYLGYYNVCAFPLLGIDVVCNKDFDIEHPAGSKVNNILLYYQSLETYSYLQDKTHQGEDFSNADIKNFKPRRLDLIPENPVYLMESEFWIKFGHAPATPGTYEFTIKFTFGPDPLTGETVDIEPVTVSMEF